MRTTTTLPDTKIYHVSEQARLEAIASLADVERAGLTMAVQPISSLSVKAAQDRGGNPFGLDRYFAIQAAMRKIVDIVDETAKNESYLSFRYANYAAPDQDPLASYGEESNHVERDCGEV
ncbi:hypothetical protein BDV10DRAFT_186739 [Aspergillus recurvatus]